MKTKVLSRFFSQVVVLILVLGLLAGCGGGVQPTATTAGPTTTAPTTGAPAPIAAGEVIKWRWQSMGVPGMKSYWVYEDLVKRVTAATGGRLLIELLPVGAVVGTMESFDAVSKGVVEVGSSCDCYWEGKDNRFAIEGMIPAHFTFDEAVTWFFNADVGGAAKSQELFNKFNLHWILYQSNVTEAEYLSNKKITTVADFKGLKFRGTGWTTKVVNEMGGSGVMMPYQDVYSALERGLIDACEVGTPSGNWDLKFHEVVKYQGFPGLHKLWETGSLMINLDAWNKLPKDLQAILEMACSENFLKNAAFGWWDSIVAIQKQKDYGMQMVTESPELQKYWRDTAWKLADDIGKTDANWKALWDPMKDFMKKMGDYEKLQTPNYGP